MNSIDVVIGCITNYNFEQIKYWVNSLDRSGFKGLKVMVCYNIDIETIRELTNRNYKIFFFNLKDGGVEYPKQNFNICVDRFHDMPIFLRSLYSEFEIRYVITTDVRDVVFQQNPIYWIERHLSDKQDIIAASESIRYKDEDWGNNNLRLSFPEEYASMLDNVIYNAGVIAGRYDAMIKLMTTISHLCKGKPDFIQGGGGPDQAALNVALHKFNDLKSIVRFTRSVEGWAAQCGTTNDPSKLARYQSKLLDPNPVMINNSVHTANGIKYAIVHQYDRHPNWKKTIEAKYE